MKSNDQIIVIEEIKMNLLAKSCFSPGIIAMLSNLITSSSEEDNAEHASEWIEQYIEGMGHEIYRTTISPKFEGYTFSRVANIAYNEFRGIVFALEVEITGKTVIKLNPGIYVIPPTLENKVHVYVICEDKSVADKIATYDMSSDDILQVQSYNNRNLSE